MLNGACHFFLNFLNFVRILFYYIIERKCTFIALIEQKC